MKRTFWWSIINQFGRLVPILLPPATQPCQRLAAQLENIWKAKTVAKVDRQRWWWSTMWLESTTQNGQFWGSPRVERSIHTGRSNPWPSECLPRIVGEWLSSAAFSCIDTVVAIISECCDNIYFIFNIVVHVIYMHVIYIVKSLNVGDEASESGQKQWSSLAVFLCGDQNSSF